MNGHIPTPAASSPRGGDAGDPIGGERRSDGRDAHCVRYAWW